MRSNCNGPGVIPQQPYSNIKNEESNNGDDNDDEEEDDDDEVEGEEEETGSILSVKNINNNCQIIDVDKAKFTDQIDIQSSNVRYIVDTQQQPTFNMHSRSSVNTVTENHIRPVSSIALPLNPLIITSTNPVVTSDYLTHIQPVLASHASNTQLQFSSNAHLIQYHRPLHQSAQCSPASPFTCDNTIVHSKLLTIYSQHTCNNVSVCADVYFSFLLTLYCVTAVEQVNNLLLPSQMSTPYLIQHPSADHQTTLPIECSNRNNGHLLGAAGGVGGGDTYMETSLNHPYRDTTSIMDSGVSSNFSANSNNSNNTLGQMQCTLLTPVPYTKELKTDQPMFIISSVVGNNNNNSISSNNNNNSNQQQQQISKPDLIPSLTVESPSKFFTRLGLKLPILYNAYKF
ncbi:unnamed protein product [Trichobilharzia regenti]|nr:unnamed protein product [Trichobilharzia regenti]